VTKSRKMRLTGHVGCMGDRRGEYRHLLGKPERKRPIGKPRSRWEDLIKWIFKKWDGVHKLDCSGSG
jgi:hypothetical protein